LIHAGRLDTHERMAEDTARAAQATESLDVKKHRAAGSSGGPPSGGSLRLAVRGVSELLGGVAEASAEAFRGFNTKLAAGAGASSSMAEDVLDGLAEGNACFLEGVARASRHAYDHMKTPSEPPAPTESIDYERLARLVAVELKKMEKDKG
jgi:hypothetical protein